MKILKKTGMKSLNRKQLISCAILLIAVVLLILSVKQCISSANEKENETKIDALTQNTIKSDTAKTKVVMNMDKETLAASDKPIYQKANSQVQKSTKKNKVEKVMIAERTMHDTLYIPVSSLETDTTIYKPWAEYHIRTVGKEVAISSSVKTELNVVWSKQKYDNHKTWLGRLLHKDKTRSVVTITDANPNIVLDNSVYVEVEK